MARVTMEESESPGQSVNFQLGEKTTVPITASIQNVHHR